MCTKVSHALNRAEKIGIWKGGNVGGEMAKDNEYYLIVFVEREAEEDGTEVLILKTQQPPVYKRRSSGQHVYESKSRP